MQVFWIEGEQHKLLVWFGFFVVFVFFLKYVSICRL